MPNTSKIRRALTRWFRYGRYAVPFPPALAPPFEILHPTLQDLFVRCFVDGHINPQARPDALTWRSALEEARDALVTCSVNVQHRFGNHLRACPWCERTALLGGHDPFPSQEAVQRREHLQPVTPPRTQRPPTRHTQTPPLTPVNTPPRTVPPPPHTQTPSTRPTQALPPTLVNSIGMQFVRIEPGTFQMGSNGWTTSGREMPVHQVRISTAFYLGTYAVTQGQWQAIMGTNPRRFTGDPNLPVENVSWDDAQKFIRQLNAREGGATYRLPTEAEWEYAARAGTTTDYSFGNSPSQLSEYAWYGLYTAGTAVDPAGPPSGSGRVLRGGGWGGTAGVCRSAHRFGLDPGARYTDLGFRLLRMAL